METITAVERAALLKALQQVSGDPAGLALLGISSEAAQELQSVLADETTRLLMQPMERAYSVPVRVQVLACSAAEAALRVEDVLSRGRQALGDEEAVVGWHVSTHRVKASAEDASVQKSA